MRASPLPLAAVLCAGAALAEGPVTTGGSLPCVSSSGRTRITVRAAPARGGAPVSSVRVFFHAQGQTGDHFLEMRPASGDEYWALFPRASAGTRGVEYRIVARDAAGQETAVAPYSVFAGPGCAPSELTPAQRKAAANLVVGQTAKGQPLVPPGFECEGIAGVISPSGQLASISCRRGGVPAAVWIGAAASGAIVGGLVIAHNAGGGGGGPVSSARPTTAP